MITNVSTGTSASRLTWRAIQQGYSPDLTEHLAAAQARGLECPLDVFEQLFHDHHEDLELAEALRFVDWRTVRWEQGQLVATMQLHRPDELQAAATETGFVLRESRSFPDGDGIV
jgi:hypothetical protein